MSRQTKSAFDTFLTAMRELCAETADSEARWQRAAGLLKRLLTDADLKRQAKTWPVCDYENLVLYEDPDHGFVVNALVKNCGDDTPIHDHAHSWTLYGLLEGVETIARFERTDDGATPGRATLAETERITITPGEVDRVPPWRAHAEYNGTARSVAIIVRSANVDSFKQNRFEPDQERVSQVSGPRQVPFPLT